MAEENKASDSARTRAYHWGQALAVFDAATPGGISPITMDNATLRPLLSLRDLVLKANTKNQELQDAIGNYMAKIDDLPDRFSLEEQGQVWLGYYHLKNTLPHTPARNEKPRKKIEWDMVDWGKTDSEIAEILAVSRSAVGQQRKKRNL